MAVASEKNTIGITMVKRRFRKISLNGFKITAFGPRINPMIDPTAKEAIRRREFL
jgi:hypothetical protein